MSMDITEHRKTYSLFMSLTKWSIISMIVLLVLMAIFLV
ncbi:MULTISPECIES: aa3-type cytochrome c oxidase subunit IV [Zavarzinia]|uniref:Aa3-type cytochrome c oxidase subunit IV n=1 Tax=Zavarzinia aquatilis TaxID=2211142 RepID=A0A317E2P2_9PROT|nr:aa3-type cytochrome c oxidase subunit IV [Zavarzinia aquatilis]PWR20430.1 aa3-type cytochrome c oxidase subunit IV [Zavarzinia aquatilis]